MQLDCYVKTVPVTRFLFTGRPERRQATTPKGSCLRNKVIRVMKLTAILLTLCYLHVSAGVSAQQITVSVKNKSLESVFALIEQQSHYTFVYRDEWLAGTKPVNLNISRGSIEQVMKAALSQQPLSYEIIDQTVIVTRKTSSGIPAPTVTVASISGRVTDEKGNPLSYVTVGVKGTQRGTHTDENGAFKLDARETDVLVFTLVGYAPREIVVGQQNTVQVTLTQAISDLNQIVVVGYGTQKKVNVTGSVASVKGQEIAKSPVTNISNALAGRLPGIRAIQNSGEPGKDGARIDIRGFGAALVIVDGVPSSFEQLDPSEIESISILKDAAAAVYGIKAANGVVLVTTKRGNVSKPKITYNTYLGLQSNTRYPRLVNAAEFAELNDESQINQGLAPIYGAEKVQQYREGQPGYESTDWYNAAIRKSTPQQYHNINVNGGTEATRYFFSLGYLNQQGMWKSGDTRFSRYNFRSNISTKITKRLTAELNLGGRLENRHYPAADAVTLMGMVQRTYPTYKLYANDNPEYYAVTNFSQNLLASMNSDYSGYTAQQYKYLSGIAALTYDIPFMDGLSAKALYSYQSGTESNKKWVKQYNLYNYNAATNKYDVGYVGNSPSNLKQDQNQTENTLAQLSLNYTKTIARDHHVKGLLLFEQRQLLYNEFSASREFVLDALDQLFAGASTNKNNDGKAREEAYMGYVGRVNYDYKDRYLLELGFRYDGSYKLAPDHRWGFFPTVSAGWRISDENFFRPMARLVNNLKIRGSWGQMGDDGIVNPFQYLTGYRYPEGGYIFGKNIVSGLTPSGIPNPLITWFNATTANIGFEAGFLQNMFTIELDYFSRKRTGLFAKRELSLPGTYGAELPSENLNSDRTRGFELALGFNKKIGDVILNVSPNVTWTRTRNLYVERANSTTAFANWKDNTTNRWTNMIWGYKAAGQFQNQEEIAGWAIQDRKGNTTLKPGDIKYEDLNGDGIIDGNDRTVIGRGNDPELYYGLNLAATWKGFSLSMLFQGASNYNVLIIDGMRDPFSNGSNTYAFFTDRWHREDPYNPNSAWIPGKYPSTIVNGLDNNKGVSSFWLKDASYLRLKTIELGYSLPKPMLSKAGIEQVRFFFSAQNLFTIDNLKVLDPETPTNDDSNAGGTGKYYPQQKVLTFGMNLQF
ncbi:TonB-dependent receptor [Chitinophaga qingshengii]|uniref:TonB-dependent receptor n=1 Tax=Chitinophaga qingshengii TaxID=1569794 RepID=A0ABR7TR78_9BACT|nr:TonB-dependent receptor [Chitinophaga qingshengii]MBC9932986.1 TonB-dependent receptor [Chitinophaga qingshengii]